MAAEAQNNDHVQDKAELSSEDLEAVAGGESILGDIGTDLVNAIDSIVCSIAAGIRDGNEPG